MPQWRELTDQERIELIKKTLEAVKDEDYVDFLRAFYNVNKNILVSAREMADFYNRYKDDWQTW